MEDFIIKVGKISAFKEVLNKTLEDGTITLGSQLETQYSHDNQYLKISLSSCFIRILESKDKLSLDRLRDFKHSPIEDIFLNPKTF